MIKDPCFSSFYFFSNYESEEKEEEEDGENDGFSLVCLLITEIDMTRHTQQSVERKRKRDDDYLLYHHRQTRNAKE